MNPNLNTLREDMAEHASSLGLAIFHSHLRSVEADDAIFWNSYTEPDFRVFLKAAVAAGAKLVTLYSRELTTEYLETLEERLENSQIERSEKRGYERRIRDLQRYAGFICQVEMSFSLAGRDYVFEEHTEWFDEMMDLMSEIRDAAEEFDDEEDDDQPMGPYFSRN